jgi:hypothetical protein
MHARPAIAVIATMSVLALGGCAFAPGSSRTSIEARDAFRSTLDELQEAIGGEWDNQDDPTSRGCVIPPWTQGVRYPGLRLSDPPAEPDAAIAVVLAELTNRGFDVENADVGDATELAGTNEFGELVVFRVSPDAMTLQGEGECRPA